MAKIKVTNPVVELDGVTVQQLELLALAAPAHFEPAVDLVKVEDV